MEALDHNWGFAVVFKRQKGAPQGVHVEEGEEGELVEADRNQGTLLPLNNQPPRTFDHGAVVVEVEIMVKRSRGSAQGANRVAELPFDVHHGEATLKGQAVPYQQDMVEHSTLRKARAGEGHVGANKLSGGLGLIKGAAKPF